MLGIRASPSGAYLLVLLRGKPAELWLVRLSCSCLLQMNCCWSSKSIDCAAKYVCPEAAEGPLHTESIWYAGDAGTVNFTRPLCMLASL